MASTPYGPATTLRILGKTQSINVRKVLWTCDEIGLAYEREEWGAGTRPTDDPAFRALNPKGLVPVLVDGGTVLSESNTIVRYLAARNGRDDLLPTEPLARAKVEEAMDWQATEFNGAWRVAFQVLVRGNAGAGSADQVARSLADWAAMIGLLEIRLDAAGPYVCGDTFTVADIVIGVSVNRWFQSPIRRVPSPAVEGYYERLRARTAAKPYLGGDTD